jgi:hypothetical protein
MDDRRPPVPPPPSPSPGGGAASDDAALGALGALARRELPAPVTAEDARRAFLRFHRQRRAAAAQAPARRRLWIPALVAGAFLGAVALRLAFPPPLAVTVSGGSLDEGEYVQAAAGGAPSLRFSDGTSVDLERATRLRIAGTSAHGARLLLEEGRARASVVPRRGARWLFDAGPCRVRVTGTRFDMRWSPDDQLLDVWLYAGSVTVEGPPARAGVAMRAGQHLSMDMRAGSVQLGALERDAAPAAGAAPPAEGPSPSAQAPAAAEAGPRRAAGARAAHAAPAPAGRGESWPAAVAAGEFASVIDEAERRGIADVLAHESAGNVMALADAARYVGQPALARRSLLRLRARFAGSPSAHRAAFLLGRLEEDQTGDVRRALEWYTVYLSDAAPDDVYRGEALGRQMAATLRVHGAERARPFAAAYLERYPHGAYADAARAVTAGGGGRP